MNKTTIKFSLVGLGIALLGLITLYTIRYFNPENRQIREAEQLIEALKRQEREDIYGGATPEETLQLFIEALKKGDTDLAAKYFVFDKQIEWRNKFNVAKQNNHLQLYIDEAENIDLGKEIYPGSYLFTIVENGKAKFIISLVLNSKNQRWKITDL